MILDKHCMYIYCMFYELPNTIAAAAAATTGTATTATTTTAAAAVCCTQRPTRRGDAHDEGGEKKTCTPKTKVLTQLRP